LAHPWPGNVRELRNVLERALAFSPAPQVLRAEHLHLDPPTMTRKASPVRAVTV
jgi:transcriptional regulator with PAS, ATPase and Fis domain